MATKEDKIRSVLQNIGKLSGVESVVLADENGFPLSSTITTQSAETISALITSLKGKISLVLKELDLDEIQTVTLKTSTREIIVTPYNSSTLVVIRKVNAD